MGLDIYAGPLTRYYAGGWETVVQREGRALGMEVQVERPGAPSDAAAGWDEVRDAVLAWRESLSAALEPHLGTPLDWPEEEEAPWFTDKPAWDCYGALLVRAAYVEHPTLRPPAALTEDDWSTDPAYRASCAPGSKTRFPALLHDVELWLPADFDFTFGAEDAAGNRVGMASVDALLRELEELNRLAWRAGEPELNAWRRAGASKDAPLEVKAQFALAVWLPLAREAARHRLPLKLDY